MTDDITARLRLGLHRPEAIILAGVTHDQRCLKAADEIEKLRQMLHDQFLDWHDVDCKYQRQNVMTCTCGHVEVAAALFGTEHEI